MPLLSSRCFALAAVLVGVAPLGAPAAQAFTVQDGSGSVSDTDQSFLYPDKGAAASSEQTHGFTQKDGMTTWKNGNTKLQFGRKPSFNERYNADHMFDPLGRPPGAR